MNRFESELIREGTNKFPLGNHNQLHIEPLFPTNNVNQLLNIPFLEAKDETKADKARQILGSAANNIDNEQLENFVMQLEFLTNVWLDLYEKQLFEGKTLREIVKFQ